jgi:hypothetical protein
VLDRLAGVELVRGRGWYVANPQWSGAKIGA